MAHSDCPPRLLLQFRHLVLDPETVRCAQGVTVELKVAYSLEHAHRRFLFLLEQTDEESPPLTEGENYIFQKPLAEAGVYSIICLNYPKVRSTIEVESAGGLQGPVQEVVGEEKRTTQEQGRPASPLCDLTEVEERDEEKEAQEEGNNSNSKSDFADYERILNDEDMRYDYMPNKYLRYFKEEFKLWRDFFEEPPALPPVPPALSNRKQPSREASSGSLSLSERESERESVISHLRSQQEMSEVQEEEKLNRTKIMKKTNSEYCFNPDRDTDKPTPSPSKRKQINTNTSSPNPRTEQSEADSFVDWATAWADGQKLPSVVIPRLGDRHLVRQWLSFLQNKFKISEIMYG